MTLRKATFAVLRSMARSGNFCGVGFAAAYFKIHFWTVFWIFGAGVVGAFLGIALAATLNSTERNL